MSHGTSCTAPSSLLLAVSKSETLLGLSAVLFSYFLFWGRWRVLEPTSIRVGAVSASVRYTCTCGSPLWGFSFSDPGLLTSKLLACEHVLGCQVYKFYLSNIRFTSLIVRQIRQLLRMQLLLDATLSVILMKQSRLAALVQTPVWKNMVHTLETT